MRCDLHVHSIRSGPARLPLLGQPGNECYSEPREVYARCRSLGMDLVTLTDHDTIEGALEIAGLEGVFVSEELTLELPEGRQVHLGLLDISETQHFRMSGLRHDAEAFFAYCAQERVPVALNHAFSLSTGRREMADYELVLDHVTAVETRNGMMSDEANRHAEWMAEVRGLPRVGGSDAHTLASVGRAYSCVPGARTKAEFLEGLRRGLVIPRGHCGSYARLTQDVLCVLGRAYRDNTARARRDPTAARNLAVLLAASPGLALVPLITAVQFWRDRQFGRRQFRSFCSSLRGPVRFRPLSTAPWQGGAPAGSLG